MGKAPFDKIQKKFLNAIHIIFVCNTHSKMNVRRPFHINAQQVRAFREDLEGVPG